MNSPSRLRPEVLNVIENNLIDVKLKTRKKLTRGKIKGCILSNKEIMDKMDVAPNSVNYLSELISGLCKEGLVKSRMEFLEDHGYRRLIIVL